MMPNNTPENRKKYPNLIGKGSDIAKLPIYSDKRASVAGVLRLQIKRMEKYPNILFGLDADAAPCALGKWRAVCSMQDCLQLITINAFQVGGFDVCSEHRKTPPRGSRERARDPLLIRLMDENKIVTLPHPVTGRPIHWIHCENESCTELIRYTSFSKGKGVGRCYNHRITQVVAGRRTRSLAYIKHKDIIVEWKNFPWSKGVFLPMASCSVDGCKNTIRFHRDWTTKGRENRKCSSCFYKYGALRPYETSYRRLLDSKKKTNRNVSITYEQFLDLCKQPGCEYCGTPIVRLRKYTAYFLDRKDNWKDYTLENCVPCCVMCNATKHAYVSYEEMLVLGAIRSGDTIKATELMNKHQAAILKHVEKIKYLRLNGLRYVTARSQKDVDNEECSS